jgi:nucleoside-diphosphate-sugar epimerase
LIIQNINSGFTIFNIANGEQIPVSYIAQCVKNHLNSDKSIVFTQEKRLGDPMFWQADISKITGLGYKKTVAIEDGIEQYVFWGKKYI